MCKLYQVLTFDMCAYHSNARAYLQTRVVALVFGRPRGVLLFRKCYLLLFLLNYCF